MSELWTDKKRGFVSGIPASFTNLSFKRWLKEQGGLFVTQMSQVEPDGSVAIVKGHGMYEKVIYTPTGAGVEVGLSLICGIPSEFPGYLIFYRDNAVTMVGTWDSSTNAISNSQAVTSLGMANFTDKVYCHAKRFMHNVHMLNGSVVNRELYLVAMSFQLTTSLPTFPGWVTFVAANPTFPLVTDTANTLITMTPKVLSDLRTVNTNVNNSHSYTPDGSLDTWTILGPGQSGDCEDMALTKAQMLLDMGYPASAIRLAAGKTATGLGHAWLVVQSDQGDYALDINYPLPKCDGDLPYTDRQRQTGKLWKSMSILDSFKNAIHAGYSANHEPNVRWYLFDPLINKFTTLFAGNSALPYMKYRVSGSDFSNLVLNVCNFSEDENTIYLSSGVKNYNDTVTSWNYAIEYKEMTSSILGYNILEGPDSVPYGNWPLYVDRHGNFYFLDLSTYELKTYNVHTTAITVLIAANYIYPNQNGFRDYQITTLNGYYGFNAIKVSGTYESGYFPHFNYDSIPPGHYNYDATGSTVQVATHAFGHDEAGYDHVFGDYRDVYTAHIMFYDWTVTEDYLKIHPSVTLPSESSTEYTYEKFQWYSSVNTKYYSAHEHQITGEWTVNPELFGYSSEQVYTGNPGSGTIKYITPFDTIDLGNLTYLTTWGARKYPFGWFHLQGKTNTIQAFVITDTMTWGDVPAFSSLYAYKDGNRIDSTLAAAAGVDVSNILGLVYTPAKEA